jgi:hypothetical protein
VKRHPTTSVRVFNMDMRWVMLLVTASVGTAYADPPKTAPPPANDPGPQPVVGAQPLTRTPTVAPFLVFDPPPPPVASLRLEALRIAGERADNDWRYPTPEPVFGYQDGGWFMGYGAYRPRTKRSAALHGGAMASTLLGEILIGSGSPLAGVGALVTGATLDAAAADVDRDHEAKRKR